MIPNQEALMRRGTAVVTFEAYDRATGAQIVVDDRTFDPALHSLDPIAQSAGAS